MIGNSSPSKSGSGRIDDTVSSLFQPDTLLTEQFLETYRRKTPLEPEKRLMLAVLEDAVACFQKYLGAQKPKEKGLFQEVEEWFSEEEGDWFFSFENICETLGLDPDYLRRGLVEWKERKLRPKAKIYHLNRDQGSKNPGTSSSKVINCPRGKLKNGTR